MSSLAVSPSLVSSSFRGLAVTLVAAGHQQLTNVKAHMLPVDCFKTDAEPGIESNGIIWLGPNERLVMGSEVPDMPAHVFVTDVSHQYTLVDIKGRHMLRLMQTGTGAFPTTIGGATRLGFADMTLIVRHIDSDHARCLVDRSVAQWFWDYLVDRIKTLGL